MEIQPKVIPTEKSGEWEVIEEFTYRGVTIYKGFRTDGASIPWIAQAFIKKGGKLFGPAVVHDFLYRHGVGRKGDADTLLLRGMEDNLVSLRKRIYVYQAVNIFGIFAWKGIR